MIKREQMKNLFTDHIKTMPSGLWFSDIKHEGECKEWDENGQLLIHCFYKHNKIVKNYLK